MIPSDIEKLKAEFGDRAFSGVDVARVLDRDAHGTGGIFKFMLTRHMVRKIRSGAYQFLGAAPIKGDAAPDAVISAPPVAIGELLSSAAPVALIGEYFFHERMLHVVTTAPQEGSPALRFHTTIIEIDPATKHPRNKVINFIKSREPREYAQALAWLHGLAGSPAPAVDETALELAADLEKQLNAAKIEIAELKAKLEAIRGAL